MVDVITMLSSLYTPEFLLKTLTYLESEHETYKHLFFNYHKAQELSPTELKTIFAILCVAIESVTQNHYLFSAIRLEGIVDDLSRRVEFLKGLMLQIGTTQEDELDVAHISALLSNVVPTDVNVAPLSGACELHPHM